MTLCEFIHRKVDSLGLDRLKPTNLASSFSFPSPAHTIDQNTAPAVKLPVELGVNTMFFLPPPVLLLLVGLHLSSPVEHPNRSAETENPKTTGQDQHQHNE
jgi:hypothetical protein